MSIIINTQKPKNVKYGSLNGSGIIQRGPICLLNKCKPKQNIVEKTPVPKPKKSYKLQSLKATKLGKSSNRWELQGITYKTFNSLWINISKQQYTVLKLK